MPLPGLRRTARPNPSPIWTPEFVAQATASLRRDRFLREAIDRIGPCTLRPEPRHFSLLVRIVISQQISMKAARGIAERLRVSLPRRRLAAADLTAATVDQIRSAGLTRSRAATVKLLAEQVAAKRLRLGRLSHATDDEVVAALTALKGVGVWTAEMLLIFGHGRPDVFPATDLGVRKAIADLHGQAHSSPAACRAIADGWRPYRSVATWYLWRHADRTNATLGLSRYPV